MGMLSNLPVYLDETTNIKAEDVSELMYQISQGVGRTRLRSDSTVREAAEWSTIVLTSGNRSMVGRLMEAKVDPEAELVRLFEYNMPKHAWFEKEMNGIYDVLEANYGHAGERYISFLVRLSETETKQRLKEMGDNFKNVIGFNGKERFWHALVACVLYGMWLAESSGAVKFADINATYQRLWAWCIEQVMQQRGVVDENKVNAIEALSMFLNAHLADRLVVMENRSGLGEVIVLKHPAAHGDLMVEYNQTKGVIYIDQNAIRNWFNKHQLNPHQIRRDLIAQGVVKDYGKRDFKVTLGRGTQYKSGQTRVWEINAKHDLLNNVDTILQQDYKGVKDEVHGNTGV
jgi:hypothetical protein